MVTLDSTPLRQVFVPDVLTGGRRVGYLVFTDFIEPSEGQLREAFGFFREQGVEALDLDLCYNGGGLLNLARLLASLIRGFDGIEIFVSLLHNERLAFSNFSFILSRSSKRWVCSAWS